MVFERFFKYHPGINEIWNKTVVWKSHEQFKALSTIKLGPAQISSEIYLTRTSCFATVILNKLHPQFCFLISIGWWWRIWIRAPDVTPGEAQSKLKGHVGTKTNCFLQGIQGVWMTQQIRVRPFGKKLLMPQQAYETTRASTILVHILFPTSTRFQIVWQTSYAGQAVA